MSASNKPRILVVDDSSTDLQAVNSALQEGYETHGVNHGDAAFEHLDTSPRLPDLILLDLNMPEMSGIEVLAGLKMDPRWSDIPIILMTSTAGDEEEQGLDMGASDWVQKPIDAGAVRVRVKHVLRQLKQKNRAQQMALQDKKASSQAIHSLAQKVNVHVDQMEGHWMRFFGIFGHDEEICPPSLREGFTSLIHETRADLTRIVRVTEGVD